MEKRYPGIAGRKELDPLTGQQRGRGHHLAPFVSYSQYLSGGGSGFGGLAGPRTAGADDHRLSSEVLDYDCTIMAA